MNIIGLSCFRGSLAAVLRVDERTAGAEGRGCAEPAGGGGGSMGPVRSGSIDITPGLHQNCAGNGAFLILIKCGLKHMTRECSGNASMKVLIWGIIWEAFWVMTMHQLHSD